jgi:hypothetical protein
MDRSPKLRELIIPQSCRLVTSGRYMENREQYMAQSKLTKHGQRAELPTLEEARKINGSRAA